MNPHDFGDVNNQQPPFEHRPRKARFNLTAMVSLLMFLLVTFVLLAMALSKFGVMEAKVGAGCGCGHNHHEPMIVQVSEGTLVYIDRVPFDISDLSGKLLSYKEACEKAEHAPRVLVTGDDRARYGNLVHAIDVIKAAGITEMVVETYYRASGK